MCIEKVKIGHFCFLFLLKDVYCPLYADSTFKKYKA